MPDAGHSTLPPALDAAAAALVATFFTAGRPALNQVYTEIARRSAGQLRDFKLVALGLHDVDAAFAAALLETAQAGVHRTFLTELASLGFLDLPGALAALGHAKTAPLDGLLWPQDAQGNTTLPQGWDATVAASLDMTGLLRAVNLAARRVCLVEAGPARGTGFLIGPQTVLTNWHVMAALIDPATGQARSDSAAQIRCTFESLAGAQGKPHPAVENWLVDFSPMSGPPTAPGKTLPDMTTLRPHALDFCAIRLAGAPGRERGWYDLTRIGAINRPTDKFFVFQHPFANPQRLAITTGVSLDPANPDFLHHKAWTDEGSSGGLCLDHQFQPLGLHHAALLTKAGAFDTNRAVRLSAIQSARPGLGDPDPAHDRITLLSDGSRAILGREATQDLIQDMMRTAQRPILYVRGDPKSGKTFTADLIRDCTPHDRRRIVTLPASALPVDAAELARKILTQAGAPAATVATLPKPDITNGTDTAWIASTLLPALRLALSSLLTADPMQPQTLWLVIDQLDRYPIPQTSARELLDMLYADAEAMRSLRVVLIGLDSPLNGLDQAVTRTEYLDPPDAITNDQLESCLGALMAQKMLAPAPAELKRQVDLLLAVTAMVQPMRKKTNRLELLSDVLAKVWLRSARKWT